MNMPLWFYNLAVYCAQLAMLIAAGALMLALTRLREPRIRLIYWQVLLALGVLLPVVEPWQTAPHVEQGIVTSAENTNHAVSAGINAAAALPAQATSPISVYQIVAVVLMAGLIFRLVWLAAGLVRLRRSRLHAVPLGPHAAVEQFKEALSVAPTVLVSNRISSPVTFGWRAPRVLLPGKFNEMENARQRAVICHEFLHVRRHDWLWHVSEEILRSLFWFHLGVVWLITQIRLCREQLVDREVVFLTGSRRDYLDALFEIAASSPTTSHAPALLFLSERHLKRRVKFILKEVTMSRKKLALALTTSLGGLLLTGAIAVTLLPLRTSAAQDPSTATLKTATVRPDTHFYGNPNASVTVVEFGDFQCPACRQAASVAEHVRKDMSSQVRFAYRQFPLTRFHHQAEKAAEAAECAAEQGKFWRAVNYLSEHPLDFSDAGVRHFAASVGLDQAQTARCLSSGKMAARVQQDIRDGRALGIRSVPTFFIGNTRVVGLQPYSRLHALIEQQLRAGGGDIPDTTPHGSTLLAAASLPPTIAEGLNGQSTDTPSQKPGVTPDPKPQHNPSASAEATDNHKPYINQTEIQRQLDEAMKQAKIAQEAAAKIDQKKLQEQIEQAMKQAEIAQKNLVKIDQERVRQQMEEAMKQIEKLNTPEMRLKMQQQMKRLQEMNTQEMQQKMQEAMKQLQEMNLPEMHRQFQEQMEQLKKIDTPEMQEQLRHAMEQAKVAQEAAAKVNKAELQRQLEQARKEVQQARKEAQAAREEARKAHQDAMKARREAEEQRKAVKPAPSATPKPAPAPPKGIAPPLPPPAPPALPKTPESAGIVGGVRGGVVGGVAGGITRGVITTPQPPVPPSTSPKVVAPSPPPASPAPPSPPQD